MLYRLGVEAGVGRSSKVPQAIWTHLLGGKFPMRVDSPGGETLQGPKSGYTAPSNGAL